ILCQTYPLVGNYGIDPNRFESPLPRITGYIVSELCRTPSHYSSKNSLDGWLAENGIPGICGIDTRKLTKVLRTKGVMLGTLQASQAPDVERLQAEAQAINDPNQRDLVGEVSVTETQIYGAGNNGPAIAAIDCGIKMNIIRSLVSRGAKVVRLPADCPADKIMGHKPDGLFISNGPGDPKRIMKTVAAARSLMEYGLPAMGICLGIQVFALAIGADTYKLKFGHRGQNHPVLEAKRNRCYITSQNHGFAVDAKTLPSDVEVTHVNANDRTVEGIASEKRKFFAVQWHPEACPGPSDTSFLFDRFLKAAGGGRG
ncbi:MAG: glutamine-hydrolyzing carbamoyl-phosphate synthase small subunit, partial [Candidatus Aenigmarchaeota archaeon]|nr:glutamine-hydrolyzing carbamoyl-phosphate synthase small subunit [Candidatus Aenigmarchaeota archaeon]